MLGIASCAGIPIAYQLPRVWQADTKNIIGFRLTGSVPVELRDMWLWSDSSRIENARCLYGRLKTLGTMGEETFYAIVINRSLPANYLWADSTRINYGPLALNHGCTLRNGFVGVAHTHIGLNNELPQAEMSKLDTRTFWRAREEVLSLVVWGATDSTLYFYWRIRHGDQGTCRSLVSGGSC